VEPCSLYASLLGPAWRDLHPSLRHFHHGETTVRATGRFDICLGHRVVARLLARLLQLPASAPGCPTRLVILPDADGETWHRSFGEYRVVSRQRKSTGTLLVERFRLLEFRFRLHVLDGGIVYQQVAVALRLGLWRVPLPRWMGPSVVAQETPAADDFRKTNVCVQVSVPLAGNLLFYSGSIACEDPSR
jgi:hypothetical protein